MSPQKRLEIDREERLFAERVRYKLRSKDETKNEESDDKLLHTSLGRELTPSTKKQDKTRHREPPTTVITIPYRANSSRRV